MEGAGLDVNPQGAVRPLRPTAGPLVETGGYLPRHVGAIVGGTTSHGFQIPAAFACEGVLIHYQQFIMGKGPSCLSGLREMQADHRLNSGGDLCITSAAI